MLREKRLPTLILFLLFVHLLNAQTFTEELLNNNARYYVNAQNENETIEVCGLEIGKKYKVYFNGEQVPSALQQNMDLVSESNCEIFPIPFTGDGVVSVACINCPSQTLAAKNSFPPNTFIVSPYINYLDLVENVLFSGNCYEISNITSSVNYLSQGSYQNLAADINDGIVLSTGYASNIPTNSSNFASDQILAPSDVDLESLVNYQIVDANTLSFSFTPSDTMDLVFKYIFASEEYCEYSNTQFNDVFGIFVSGPGINGPYSNNAENIAHIPNGFPTMVNGVNETVNPQLFRPNGTDCPGPYILPETLVYDGFTAPLTAEVSLLAEETYHFKIAIGDASDGNYDSAVFIESFEKEPDYNAEYEYYPEMQAPSTGDTLYENCANSLLVRLERGPDFLSLLEIPLIIDSASTAIEGVDFDSLPSEIIIPSGQPFIYLPITIFEDDITEGLETLILDFGGCLEVDTIFIKETAPWPEIEFNIYDTEEFFLVEPVITGSYYSPYQYYSIPQWSIDSGTVDTSGWVVFAEFTEEALLTCTFVDNFCNRDTSIVIPLVSCSDSLQFSTSIIQNYECNGSDHDLFAETVGGQPPYQFTWSTGSDTANEIVTMASGDVISVTIVDDCSNTIIENFLLEEIPFLEITGFNQTQTNCDTNFVTVLYESSYEVVDIVWSNGESGATATNLTNGDHSVVLTDEAGCTVTDIVNVQSDENFTLTGLVTELTGEDTDDGAIFIIVNGGTPPFNYEWSNGMTTSDIANLSSGTYTVTVTDANGCTQTVSFTILNPTVDCALSVEVSITDTSCAGSEDGNITITIDDGNSPYDYSWSNGANTSSIFNLSAGNYAATITDITGCFVELNELTVDEGEELMLTIFPQDTIICLGESVTLTPSGSYSSYTWSTGDNTSSISVNTSGAYSLTVTDDAGCEGIQEVFVDVFWDSSIYTTDGETEVQVGDTVVYSITPAFEVDDEYLWYLPTGGEIISTDTTTSVIVVWTEPGNFNLGVGILSANGCLPDGFIFNVTADLTNTVSSLDLSNEIQLFPNPVSDLLTIKSTLTIQTVRFYDLTGRVIYTADDFLEKQINVSPFPSGIYFVEMKTEKGTWTKRIARF